jgi:hypothetical protein
MFISCKDNSTEPPTHQVLVGTIQNWTGDGTEILRVVAYTVGYSIVLDSTYIGRDGKFTLPSPLPSIPNSMLWGFLGTGVSDKWRQFTDHIERSKGFDYSCPTFEIYSHDQLMGVIRNENKIVITHSDLAIGDYVSHLSFVSTTTTVSGYYIMTLLDSTFISQYGQSQFRSEYNLNLKPGWNYVTLRVKSLSDSLRIYEVITESPPENKYFVEWTDPLDFSEWMVP